MCACGCFVIVAIVAVLAYAVIHGLWVTAIAVLLIAALLGWLGRKMFVSGPPGKTNSQK